MMRIRHVLPLLMLGVSPLVAQQVRPPAVPGSARLASTELGAVRGVVYDSLIRAPLAGAHVWIIGTSASAITDDAGRFRLDSLQPGRAVIAFEHAELDSVGLSTNIKRIDIIAGRPVTIELDVPSHTTMYRTACGAGGAAHAARDSGVVFGMVEDVGRHARLSGARVVVSWVAARVGQARVEVTRPGVTVMTDSLGNYYACGIPKEYVVTVSAFAGPFRSGTTELLLGARGIARRDLGLTRDSSSSLIADSMGERRGRATLMGTVTDSEGNPRPGVRVSVDDALSQAFSDESGRFVVRNLPPGSQTVMARMIGYSASRLAVMLRDDDTTRIEMRVRALTVLDTIRVTSRAGNSRIELDQLEQRMRMGSAYFLTGEQVKRRAGMRQVFQGLPSIVIQGRTPYEFTITTLQSGRPTPVSLWVDGFPASVQSIQSYRPDQIVAVEWYPRGMNAPMKYQPSGTNPNSGVLLVWTRFIR